MKKIRTSWEFAIIRWVILSVSFRTVLVQGAATEPLIAKFGIREFVNFQTVWIGPVV